tara:strand:- start:108 stop:533 length:426 start_codon:yes stop_codon:yes gene_type:complete
MEGIAALDVVIKPQSVAPTGTLESELLYYAFTGDAHSMITLINTKRKEIGLQEKDAATLGEEEDEIHPDLFDFLNERSEQGWIALYLACAMGNTDCAEVLINAGSDVDFEDASGRSVLFVTAFKGYTGTHSPHSLLFPLTW